MTLNGLDDRLVLFDLNGHPHEIKIAQIQKTLVIGWTFYLLGFILNITYYQVTYITIKLCVWGGDLHFFFNYIFEALTFHI